MTGWAETSWSERADRTHPAAQVAGVAALVAFLAAVVPNWWVERLMAEGGGSAFLPIDLADRAFFCGVAGLTAAALYALVRWLGEGRSGRETAVADHPLRVEPLAADRDLGPRFDESPYLVSPPPTPDARIDPDSTLSDPRWRVPELIEASEPDGWAAARAGLRGTASDGEHWDLDGGTAGAVDDEDHWDMSGEVAEPTEDVDAGPADSHAEDADADDARTDREDAAAGDEWERWVSDHQTAEAEWAEPDDESSSEASSPTATVATVAPMPSEREDAHPQGDAATLWDGQERRARNREDWPAGDRRRPTRPTEVGREDPELPTTAELLDRLTRAAERAPAPDGPPRERPHASDDPAAELQAAIDALRRVG